MTVYEPLETRDFPYEGIYQLLVKEHALLMGSITVCLMRNALLTSIRQSTLLRIMIPVMSFSS